MRKGKILVDRNLEDDPIFDNPKILKVWIWCLMRANHSPANVLIGNQYVQVKRGQFITGRKEAAKALKMPESTVRNYLDFLACRRSYKYRLQQNPIILLDIQPRKLFSIITVKYYDDIQSFGQVFGQRKDTTNNEDNDLKKRDSLREEDKDKVGDKLSLDDIRRTIKKGESFLRSAKQKKEPNQLYIDAITHGLKQLKEELKEKEAK